MDIGHQQASYSGANSRSHKLARIAGAVLCAVLAATPYAVHAAQPAGGAPSDWVKGRLLVMPRAGLTEANLAKAIGVGGAKARQIGHSRIYIVDLPAGVSETALVQQLAHHPQLKYAELDRRMSLAYVPNDPYTGSEWHLTKIGVPTALDTAGGAGVTIAILDTGTDCTHPDLSPNCVAGWNFYDNNSNTSDVQGHGTATAGAAAASTNNGIGVASVSGLSKIMPIRVTDPNGGATASTVAQGITYASDHGARVASISIDGVYASSATISAAQYMKNAGGLVVVAAGNSGTQQTAAPTTAMIPVSATNSSDTLETWSNYGSYVTMSAPGDTIWTTQMGGSYWACWGTSLSTPIVAGTIALMMSANPTLPSTQVQSLLQSTATPLGGTVPNIYYGYGRVNAAGAVQAAAAAATAPPLPAPPTASIGAPLAGATVSGLVPVDVSASAGAGVAKVVLMANGVAVATDTTSPYAFSWDSTTVPNGTVSLTAVTYDSKGNTATSSPVSVSVANVANAVAPASLSVAITNPTGGTLNGNGTVNVSSSATDTGVAPAVSQSLYIDGVLKTTVTGSSLSYGWNLKHVAAGTHTLTVVGKDNYNNSVTTSVQVTR